jgi:hypothetical protein
MSHSSKTSEHFTYLGRILPRLGSNPSHALFFSLLFCVLVLIFSPYSLLFNITRKVLFVFFFLTECTWLSANRAPLNSVLCLLDSCACNIR